MKQPQTPPLQRHTSLQPFSRDHYFGLKQSQRLLKAANSDAAIRCAAVDEFLKVWEREIDAHLADEERLLLPLLSETDASRLKDEHTQLRELAKRAREAREQSEPDRECMRKLGKLLNDHIRWEERELFPAIEQSAGQDALEVIGHETEEVERKRRVARRK